MMESVKVYEDECVDFLTKNQYRIIQKKDGFRFSLDAVLLASFCQLKDGDKVIDLGTGSAIIPLSIVNSAERLTITGIEILPDIAEMASRSIKMNQLESHISIVNDDLRIVFEKYKSKSYDVVICNPPYHAKGSGNISPNHIQAIARHEIACTLEDVVKAANYLLQDHGRIFMILKPQRLFELLCLLEKYKLFIHKIRFVHPNLNEKANSVLVESIKKGKKSMEVMMPFIVYDNNGVYTKELNDIYYPKE